MDAVGQVGSVLDDPTFVNILRDDDIFGVEQKMADDQIRIVESSMPQGPRQVGYEDDGSNLH